MYLSHTFVDVGTFVLICLRFLLKKLLCLILLTGYHETYSLHDVSVVAFLADCSETSLQDAFVFRLLIDYFETSS